jgi:ribosomal protein L19E
MSPSAKLTAKERQNGKRKVLIPSKEIRDMMQPISREDFAGLVKKAIPPSPQPDQAAK